MFHFGNTLVQKRKQREKLRKSIMSILVNLAKIRCFSDFLGFITSLIFRHAEKETELGISGRTFEL